MPHSPPSRPAVGCGKPALRAGERRFADEHSEVTPGAKMHDRSNAMGKILVTTAAPETSLASSPEPKTMHQQADSKWHQTGLEQRDVTRIH